MVVFVGILALVAGLAYETLGRRPAQARGTAVAFARLVAEARALAAITAGDGLSGGSGATIAVVRDGDAYVATLYAYRPVLGAPQRPIRAPNTPPLRTATALGISTDHGTIEPPFAVFFSTSGHASARAPYTVGVDAALPEEPACPLEQGIIIAFIDGVHDQGHALSCQTAQLDLETSYTIGSR